MIKIYCNIVSMHSMSKFTHKVLLHNVISIIVVNKIVVIYLKRVIIFTRCFQNGLVFVQDPHLSFHHFH